MNTQEKVHAIVATQFGVAVRDFTNESTLTSLAADSLDHIELAMAIEDEFNIEIPDEDAEKIESVGDWVAYVDRRLVPKPLRTEAAWPFPTGGK